MEISAAGVPSAHSAVPSTRHCAEAFAAINNNDALQSADDQKRVNRLQIMTERGRENDCL